MSPISGTFKLYRGWVSDVLYKLEITHAVYKQELRTNSALGNQGANELQDGATTAELIFINCPQIILH